MSQLDVFFPDDLADWAVARSAERGFASLSEYVSDLMRRDREHQRQRERLLAAIDEGLASPEVDTTIEDIIAERRGAQAAE